MRFGGGLIRIVEGKEEFKMFQENSMKSVKYVVSNINDKLENIMKRILSNIFVNKSYVIKNKTIDC